MSSPPWYRAVLGGELARWTHQQPSEAAASAGTSTSTTTTTDCSSLKPGSSAGYALVPVERALGEADVVALYFPPLLGDDLTDRLVELHRAVNEEAEAVDNTVDKDGNKVAAGKVDQDGNRVAGRARGPARLRVVQVLTPLPPLPANPSTPSQPAAPAAPPPQQVQQIHVPWFAVPPEDYDRQRRVCARYRVQADVAASRLLLLDGRTGRLLTRCGRERLLADPRGLAFPWPARPLGQVLAAATLQRLGKDLAKDLALDDLRRDAKGLVLGVYFSAHWCPPCKAFTPQLVNTYNAVRERGLNFEIIFVSSDRSEESFEQYARSMPWPAVAWRDEASRQELASLLAVQGIPTLVLVDAGDKDFALISDDARARVNDDPDGKDFPWRPEPVSVFAERHSARLHDHPALILFVEGGPGEVDWAMAILKQAADVYAEKHPSSLATLREPRLQFYVAQDGDAADGLREQLVLEDSVPLLVAVDVWRGAVSVLEDEVDEDEEDAEDAISAASAVAFMEAFLAGELPSAPLGVYLPRPPPPHHALMQDAHAPQLEA